MIVSCSPSTPHSPQTPKIPFGMGSPHMWKGMVGASVSSLARWAAKSFLFRFRVGDDTSSTEAGCCVNSLSLFCLGRLGDLLPETEELVGDADVMLLVAEEDLDAEISSVRLEELDLGGLLLEESCALELGALFLLPLLLLFLGCMFLQRLHRQANLLDPSPPNFFFARQCLHSPHSGCLQASHSPQRTRIVALTLRLLQGSLEQFLMFYFSLIESHRSSLSGRWRINWNENKWEWLAEEMYNGTDAACCME
jgi:hypothetical protein